MIETYTTFDDIADGVVDARYGVVFTSEHRASGEGASVNKSGHLPFAISSSRRVRPVTTSDDRWGVIPAICMRDLNERAL